MVRDPVTRAISDYAQAASKRKKMKSFEELAFVNQSTGESHGNKEASIVKNVSKSVILRHFQSMPLRQQFISVYQQLNSIFLFKKTHQVQSIQNGVQLKSDSMHVI